MPGVKGLAGGNFVKVKLGTWGNGLEVDFKVFVLLDIGVGCGGWNFVGEVSEMDGLEDGDCV